MAEKIGATADKIKHLWVKTLPGDRKIRIQESGGCHIGNLRYHRSFIFGGYQNSVNGSLAQLVEQLAFNQLVEGSNPSRPTIHFLVF
jgi:hypothetical protein